MKDYCACGRVVYAHWAGKGDYCLGCFNNAYWDMNHEDEEFEKKQEKIKRNFHANKTRQI